ncbi:MAG: AAA family ATPase [Desulfobulbaceae bacterium]
MLIRCEKCNSRYNLDVSAISKPVFKVRCAQCNHGFEVRKKLEPDSELLRQERTGTVARHEVIAVSNQKGGVAKTSTCLNLGMALAQLGNRVLLVDFDVQANLTTSLGFSSNSLSFYDILQSGAENISPHVRETRYANLSILPSNSRMALLTKHYMYRPNFEFLLRDRLQWVTDRYEFILLDTPPALDFCTLNALMAADRVLIPTPCEYLSMHGIHKIEDIIKVVQKKSGRDIDYRILIAMHDPHSTAAKVIYRKIKDMFGGKVLATTIELDEKMKESQIVNLPVLQYDANCPSARQYMQLALEIRDLPSPGPRP